jgi:hypothetical protein
MRKCLEDIFGLAHVGARPVEIWLSGSDLTCCNGVSRRTDNRSVYRFSAPDGEVSQSESLDRGGIVKVATIEDRLIG